MLRFLVLLPLISSTALAASVSTLDTNRCPELLSFYMGDFKAIPNQTWSAFPEFKHAQAQLSGTQHYDAAPGLVKKQNGRCYYEEKNLYSNTKVIISGEDRFDPEEGREYQVVKVFLDIMHRDELDLAFSHYQMFFNAETLSPTELKIYDYNHDARKEIHAMIKTPEGEKRATLGTTGYSLEVYSDEH